MPTNSVAALKEQGFTLTNTQSSVAFGCLILSHSKPFYYVSNYVLLNYGANWSEEDLLSIKKVENNSIIFPTHHEYWATLPFFIFSEDEFAVLHEKLMELIKIRKAKAELDTQVASIRNNVNNLIKFK